MKIATFVAATLALASSISLASISLAQQSANGQSQSEHERNSITPAPNTIRPSSTGSHAAGSDGTPPRMSGPSTPDHAWYGNDPLKSGSSSSPKAAVSRQMSR
jgi:hypothetical protein